MILRTWGMKMMKNARFGWVRVLAGPHADVVRVRSLGRTVSVIPMSDALAHDRKPYTHPYLSTLIYIAVAVIVISLSLSDEESNITRLHDKEGNRWQWGHVINSKRLTTATVIKLKDKGDINFDGSNRDLDNNRWRSSKGSDTNVAMVDN
jgi:hypothetical protein